jgi:hypothetical protein
MVIDMGYGLTIWDMIYPYGYPPHRYGDPPNRYGHPGYRYGMWSIDMGVDSTDTVILDILSLCLRDCFVNPRHHHPLSGPDTVEPIFGLGLKV